MRENERNKNLKIILGNKEYNNQDEVYKVKKLSGTICYEDFYREFHSVAFVPNEVRPFKHAFENILNLLFYKNNPPVNTKIEYLNILNNQEQTKQFIERLYNDYSIVLINQSELRGDNQEHQIIINNADCIIACGAHANQHSLIKQYSEKKPERYYYAIHPSHMSHYHDRYLNDWIDIRNNKDLLKVLNLKGAIRH